MKINHNISAMQTLHELNKVNDKAAKSMERLSSGLRINSAADDAAGMAITNKMDAQIRGLQQANRNTMDGISMIQTAEGALNETHAILQRVRELSVQASNGTYSEEDSQKMQGEVNELIEEVNRISATTEFNTKPLLEGGVNVLLQVGANENQMLEVNIGDMSAESLGLTGPAGTPGFSADNNVTNGKDFEDSQAALDITTQENANNAITIVDAAISKVSEQRSVLGAVQNRLEHTSSNLGVSEQNLTASMSRIRDADMAYEMAQYTQQNVLSQAATSMLAQANQRPQQVLQLLQR